MSQTSLTRKSGFSVGATCPGCAAEVELEHDFFVLTCRHCNSVVRVVMPATPPAYLVKPKKSGQEVRFLLDRYCREQGATLPPGSAPMQLLYYPYWKLDATTLKVRSTQYEVDYSGEDYTDDSHTEERELTTINLAPFTTTCPAAATCPGIPPSLGVRVDSVHMVPFMDDSVSAEAVCLPVVRSLEDAVRSAGKAVTSLGRLDQVGSLRNETRLFHPAGAIVYFPYYVIDAYCTGACLRYTVDGLSGRVAGSERLDAPSEPSEPAHDVQFGALQLELHRCSNCGADLPTTRSVVYQCHNCHHVEFFESHPQLERGLFQFALPERAGADDTLFPFWALIVESSSASSSVFGGTAGSTQLVIPAFDMRNIESTYRLAKRMTSAARQLSVCAQQELRRKQVPVSRSLADTLTLLEVLWYRELAARDVRRTDSFQSPQVRNIRLVFAPFHPEQYFYVDSILNAVTFEKAGTVTATC